MDEWMDGVSGTEGVKVGSACCLGGKETWRLIPVFLLVRDQNGSKWEFFGEHVAKLRCGLSVLSSRASSEEDDWKETMSMAFVAPLSTRCNCLEKRNGLGVSVRAPRLGKNDVSLKRRRAMQMSGENSIGTLCTIPCVRLMLVISMH